MLWGLNNSIFDEKYVSDSKTYVTKSPDSNMLSKLNYDDKMIENFEKYGISKPTRIVIKARLLND